MQRLTRKISRFRALSAADHRTFLTAMALLPAFRIMLGLVGLPRLQAWLHRRADDRACHPGLDELKRTGDLVNSACHRVLGPDNCLTRSLYLWWLLRRRGVPCELRIGVRLRDGAFEAHAWVEHAGVPVNDRHDVGTVFGAFDEGISPSRFLQR